jgi:multidrug efflux pump subunit AcrB
MLLGIVTKNSILLVDYAIIGMREGGLSEFDALLEACRKRARPILMTTVAMIAGMVPPGAWHRRCGLELSQTDGHCGYWGDWLPRQH